MTDLKTQLEDPIRRAKILAQFVGHKVIRTREEWGHVCTVKQPGGCTDFDPFATTPQGAWNFEQVWAALVATGYHVSVEREYHKNGREYAICYLIKNNQAAFQSDRPRGYRSDTHEGPLAHRYAVCAAVLEMLEGSG